MANSVIAEGKTTQEAIENGLKILKVTKDKVDIKVIEEPTKRLFSILAPRVVKVELTLKEEKTIEKKSEKREYIISEETLEKAKIITEKAVEDLFNIINKKPSIAVEIKDKSIFVNMNSADLGFLIGYRGETLDALQTILTAIVNKDLEEHVRVLVDIENYRQKREKTLESLAKSIANTVVRERKSITLEPMTPLERKIIHSALQNNHRVTTHSVGEEPYRKIVISLKK